MKSCTSDRSRARVNGAAFAVDPLPQAFCPKLAIPLSQLAQPIGVWHQDVDPGPLVLVCFMVKRRIQRRRVLLQVIDLGPFQSQPGTVEQSLDVDTDERSGKQSHRRENAEAAPDFGWNIQHGDVISLGQLAERSPAGIGGEDQVTIRRLAQRPLQPGANHEVLRHGLCRPA
jgi:hypothetical protein